MIDEVKKLVPGKPIRYVVNRTATSIIPVVYARRSREGATIITQAQNKPYFERAFAMPNTINPDHLAKSGKKARFRTVDDKLVLSDSTRTVEIYHMADSHHSDTFLMVYLPKEKLLIEADSFTPAPPNSPPPAQPNPHHTISSTTSRGSSCRWTASCRCTAASFRSRTSTSRSDKARRNKSDKGVGSAAVG